MIIIQNYIEDFGLTILNSFDLAAWKTHTCLERVGFCIRVKQGGIEFRLQDENAVELCGGARNLNEHEKEACVTVEFSEMANFIVPSVRKLTEKSEFEYFFYSDMDSFTDFPKINYVVCTYNKNIYVSKLVDNFQIYTIMRDSFDFSEITIVDNGNNLSYESIPFTTIIPSKNVGGTGGFGRGMYETAYGEFARKCFTHVCLMDDDILVNPELFLRNYFFVAFLKERRHVGAPMYPVVYGAPDLSRISCAGHMYQNSWHPNDWPLGHRLKTNDHASIAEMCRTPDSTGWWWNVISVLDIKRVGLPFPFFVKMDDVEYSLRLRDAGVTLVIPLSLSVLHDDFDAKYSARMQYFRFRNRWILLSLRNSFVGAFSIANFILHECFQYVFERRYEHAEVLLMAVRDFLKGPGQLGRDAKGLLTELDCVVECEANRPLDELDEYPEPTISAGVEYRGFADLWCIATLNGHLKIGRRSHLTVDVSKPFTFNDVDSASSITYVNPNSRTGYTVNTQILKAVLLAWRAVAAATKLLFFGKRAAGAYRGAFADLTSPAFWSSYGRLDP